MENIFVALDIGTSKVSVLVANIDMRGFISVRGKGISYHSGIKKGVLVDIEGLQAAIAEAINQAETESELKLKSTYVNIAGINGRVLKNKAFIVNKAKGSIVGKNEWNELIKKVCNVESQEKMELVDLVPVQYFVDDNDGIVDVIGMSAREIGLEADLIFANRNIARNIYNCLQNLGIETEGFILESMATSDILLTQEEKEKGVLLVDVGGSLTNVSFVKEGKVEKEFSLPVGGDHITSDLAFCLNISQKEAEKVKRKYELALTKLIENDQELYVKDIDTNNRKIYKVSEAIQIIEERVKEVCSIIKDNMYTELDSQDFSSIIFTGAGISYMDGLAEMVKEIFNLPARIATLKYIGWEDVEYGVCACMIKYVSKRMEKNMSACKVFTKREFDSIKLEGFGEIKRRIRVLMNKIDAFLKKVF